jgi:hypothetical protein
MKARCPNVSSRAEVENSLGAIATAVNTSESPSSAVASSVAFAEGLQEAFP